MDLLILVGPEPVVKCFNRESIPEDVPGNRASTVSGLQTKPQAVLDRQFANPRATGHHSLRFVDPLSGWLRPTIPFASA